MNKIKQFLLELLFIILLGFSCPTIYTSFFGVLPNNTLSNENIFLGGIIIGVGFVLLFIRYVFFNFFLNVNIKYINSIFFIGTGMLIIYNLLLYIIGNLRGYYADNFLIKDLNLTLLLIIIISYFLMIIYNFILDNNKKINLGIHLKIFFSFSAFSIFALFLSYLINNIIFGIITINISYLIYFYFFKSIIKNNEIILKNLNKQIVIKSSTYLLILYITLFILAIIYSFVFEQDKLAIDRYNFEQRNVVKSILKNVSEKEMHFYNFKQFNETYNTDITPIKNCFVLSFNNGDKPYIFGFQLESLIYRFIHFGKNYAYPSYSRPRERYCFGEGPGGGCYYSDKQPFIETISNPCRD